MKTATTFVTPGALALAEQVQYHRLNRALNRALSNGTAVPGLVRLTRGVAFDPERLDETRQWMRDAGVFRQEMVAAAG